MLAQIKTIHDPSIFTPQQKTLLRRNTPDLQECSRASLFYQHQQSIEGSLLFIAVIGPSGVGKSHCCEAAEHCLHWKHTDLDALIRAEGMKKGFSSLSKYRQSLTPRQFFDASKRLCAQERAQKHRIGTLVNIGAGSQDFELSSVKTWLKDGFDYVITIIDDKRNCHMRRSLGRSLEEYSSQEFSKERMCIYEMGDDKYLVNGKTKTQSQEGFIIFLKQFALKFPSPAGTSYEEK